MGKVIKYIHSSTIDPIADEASNRFQIEHSHDGIHIHYRNLRLKLSKKEALEWKHAFTRALPIVKHQNLL